MQSYIQSNTLQFWQRILLMPEESLPKILAKRIIKAEMRGELKQNNWARYFFLLLSRLGNCYIAMDPFTNEYFKFIDLKSENRLNDAVYTFRFSNPKVMVLFYPLYSVHITQAMFGTTIYPLLKFPSGFN